MTNEQQQLDARLGAALYRVARLKQRIGGTEAASRLAPRLLQELERLTDELQRSYEELAEARAAYEKARRLEAESDSRARLVFEACPTPCMLVNTDSTIIEANRAAAVLLNVSVRHLAGKPLHLFINGQRTEFLASLRSLESGGQCEWSGRLQPRERCAVQVDITAITDAHDQCVLFLVSRLARGTVIAHEAAPDAGEGIEAAASGHMWS
ncbi:MAG TPA: PAS domain-containing protein [Vicinamibacterales bacterium]|nr:PAS domain-containing protein [Vicinamibacterales bacterium]